MLERVRDTSGPEFKLDPADLWAEPILTNERREGVRFHRSSKKIVQRCKHHHDGLFVKTYRTAVGRIHPILAQPGYIHVVVDVIMIWGWHSFISDNLNEVNPCATGACFLCRFRLGRRQMTRVEFQNAKIVRAIAFRVLYVLLKKGMTINSGCFILAVKIGLV